MPNSFDTDGRGPSNRQLFACGLAVLLTAALVTVLLLAKSTGRLNAYVRVVADLVNVGDGLPQKSDVKYHGVLVGSVDTVIPAAHGAPNFVHINLTPQYAKSMSSAVTARVVPSNVFAVSSVQLIDHGAGGPIREGAHIAEDTSLPTVLFETTITKLRDVLSAFGRGRDDNTIGVLAAIGAATDHRRVKLLASGAQLHRMINQLNAIVSTGPGPSMVSALIAAADGLATTAPDLLDALHSAVKPMQTLAQQRQQLDTLVSGGLNTFGTTRQAFDNHTAQLIQITSSFTPVLGVLAIHSNDFVPIFTRLNMLSDKVFSEAWDPELATGNMRVNLSLTPSYSYTRADCPRYGELKGPSCFTAPVVPVRPELPPVLLPQNFRPPPGLAPPPGTEVGPDGNLIAVGPPVIDPNPNLEDPNPPLPPLLSPSPPVPGTANPDNAAPAPVAPVAPSRFGGSVGPVGSSWERQQLSIITGHQATVATQLLLGPVARGTNVTLKPTDPPGRPQ